MYLCCFAHDRCVFLFPLPSSVFQLILPSHRLQLPEVIYYPIQHSEVAYTHISHHQVTGRKIFTQRTSERRNTFLPNSPPKLPSSEIAYVFSPTIRRSTSCAPVPDWCHAFGWVWQGAIAGGTVAGWASQYLGRRLTIMCASFPFFLPPSIRKVSRYTQ
jgi:hypothetical protein